MYRQTTTTYWYLGDSLIERVRVVELEAAGGDTSRLVDVAQEDAALPGADGILLNLNIRNTSKALLQCV